MIAVIEVNDLHKHYGSTVAVDGLSLTVEPGEIFGILGPNGAGKTTTVECIAGLRVPDSGQLKVLGLDPRRDRPQLRQRVGVQLQESQLPDKIRVAEAMELYSSFFARPANWLELLDGLGLADKQATKFSKLSGGQRQRLSVALALVGNPEIAILDELTTGLDPQARRDTWALVSGIRDRGVTVVLVTHYMEEAERLCGRVAVIDSGRVVALDTPVALASAAGTEQRIRFRPSRDLDDRLLSDLPEVTSVTRQGGLVVVTGSTDALNVVTTVLARASTVAQQLRVDQSSLEDAFVALTGRHPGADGEAADQPPGEHAGQRN